MGSELPTHENFRDRAQFVIDLTFGGTHHVESLKWHKTWCSFLVHQGISTYDFSGLTRLVVACHDECVRAEIGNGGPRRLKITLSHRVRRDKHPDMYACPELDQHVRHIRADTIQELYNELRLEVTNAT